MKRIFSRIAAVGTAAIVSAYLAAGPAAATTLADQPIFSTANVPGNLALALSVEFPTAISVANIGNYADASTYLGYFDPLKCYTYTYNAVTPASSYFQPASLSTGANQHTCSGQWSGNFMNWVSMQTIDPFRWALTGGYRSVDTTSTTILEKAWGATQGSAAGNFNYRGTTQGSPNNLSSTLISQVTPFSNWLQFNTGIWGNGNMMVFSGGTGFTTSATSSGVNDLSSVSLANSLVASLFSYRVYIRVKVCDATTSMGTNGLESNCVQYGNNYKPQGLMQTYANTVRYAAFSYLNQNGYDRQGGVLREPMGFIGPTYPQPLSSTLVTNTRPEWDPATGIMSVNPDTTSAVASGVTQSGVMNYLNKFGEYGQNYMTYDNVGELYYAALRYYEALGNVPEWTNSLTAAELDGFPAVTTWTGTNSATGASNDPILYACQKNFILGIGDDHTWYDYNVGGDTNASGGRPKPSSVGSDSLNQASAWTTALQKLEGITQTPYWPFDSGATYFIAGLAYGAHVTDIRPDNVSLPQTIGTQTVSTFWMDVEEGGGPENLNPYYLATKYGGFTVPSGYSISNTTALPTSEWDTTGSSITMNYGQVHSQPDNYFLAGNANLMVAGLKSAFASITNAVSAFGTALSLPAANVASTGALSFSSNYNSAGWTDTIAGSTVAFSSTGNPTFTQQWVSSSTLQTQLAGTGWQTARNVATWNGSSGIPFEVANLSTSQLTALLPSYSSSTTSTQYVGYLRGDQTNEVGSTVAGSTKSLRARSLLLGDVVDANLTPVGTPSQTFSEANNPGYTAFTTQWTTTTPRPTMVYAAANDGMLHGFVGTSGLEQFAYIPSAVIQGPTSSPQTNGLAALGNPNFVHHYYVDATPVAFDIDFNRTSGNMVTTSASNSDWHTLLIGGLGKGGTSFYAIDVTNPAAMNSETAVAAKVKWEFTDSSMGYSYGAPIAVKTAQYGWVVAFTSGYNSSSTNGYLYLVNPKTGALLQKIATPSASSGLAQASAYVQDYSDYTADSIYVGDLNGQLWRFDLTTASGSYPAPTLLATLTNASGTAEPITTAPEVEIHPSTRKRYVMVGTGQLLAPTDISSTSGQSFYVIVDGTAGAFSTFSMPITRSVLTPITNSGLTAGLTDSPTFKGWYIDLGNDSTSGIAWRVNVNPTAYNGTVSFAALLTSGNACSPGGTGEVYAVNYATATSILTSANANNNVTFTSPVVSVNYVGVSGLSNGAGKTTQLVVCTADGNCYRVPANLTSAIATKLLNWRELPTAE